MTRYVTYWSTMKKDKKNCHSCFPRPNALHRLVTFQHNFRTDNHNLMRTCQISISRLLSRRSFLKFVFFCFPHSWDWRQHSIQLFAWFPLLFFFFFFFFFCKSFFWHSISFCFLSLSQWLSIFHDSQPICSVLDFPKSVVDITSDIFSFWKWRFAQR